MRRLSIIIPALNEEALIGHTLSALAPMRARGVEVIVVDGGSKDATVAHASPLADKVIHSARGRAIQMNAGARAASGDFLLFLHADTCLPLDGDRDVLAAIEDKPLAWGRFDIAIGGVHPLLPVIAAAMNIRSRLTGISTGDHSLFLTRQAYNAIGGFPEIALMEDIEMTRRLKRIAAPVCLRKRATTSGRRWDNDGLLPTMLLMWRLRLAYFCGAKPERLALRYGYPAGS